MNSNDLYTAKRDQVNPATLGDLLAVDPALNSPGCALFRGGRLIAAGQVKIDSDVRKLPLGMRVPRVVADIVRWSMGVDALPRTLIVEYPKILSEREGKSKADPADLLALAAVAGGVATLLQQMVAMRDEALVVHFLTPFEWTGNIPKSKTIAGVMTSPRTERILSRLDDVEKLLVPRQHDAIDAIGLGLKCCGRYEPVRIFPGAT